MSLRRRKKSRPAAALIALAAVLAASLAWPRAGGQAAPELLLAGPLSAPAWADLQSVAAAHPELTPVRFAGRVCIRLPAGGAIPPGLDDWAGRCGVPLPRPVSAPAIGPAEALIGVKVSPVGPESGQPALAGRMESAPRPANRPIENAVDLPRHTLPILAEHRAGRSPPAA